MDVGERIKARRIQLGMSAEQVAAKLGVSPATIYRYESKDIMNMRIDKLEPLANVLCTTPANLMGWETSSRTVQAINSASEPSLEAKKIAKAFDKATPKDKSTVRVVLSEYLDDDEQEYQYAAARDLGLVKIPRQTSDEDMPENDTIIDGL